MANNYGISDSELAVFKKQAARRVEMRKEFLKLRTNPWKHANEAGYVFDPAIQRFMSMKVTQLEFFKPTKSTSLFGVFAIVVPMMAYGWLAYMDRSTREAKIRSGELRYRERNFKFA